MKITKKHISNIVFIVVIGLMIYPPTKVYFIRLISFSPSVEATENQQEILNTNWHLKGLNTKSINLNEVENSLVFVSFWATWCPPCIAEMPSMQKLYKDYKDKVEFLFVTNENWETVSQFYKKHDYNFPTYNSVSTIPNELKSSTIPATFIISKNKRILVGKKGAANWNSTKIRELLDSELK